jgi:ABC-type enterobactin transport system permease subunit
MSDSQTNDQDHHELPNIWMYVGIVTVSLGSFYLVLLLTKLAY